MLSRSFVRSACLAVHGRTAGRVCRFTPGCQIVHRAKQAADPAYPEHVAGATCSCRPAGREVARGAPLAPQSSVPPALLPAGRPSPSAPPPAWCSQLCAPVGCRTGRGARSQKQLGRSMLCERGPGTLMCPAAAAVNRGAFTLFCARRRLGCQSRGTAGASGAAGEGVCTSCAAADPGQDRSTSQRGRPALRAAPALPGRPTHHAELSARCWRPAAPPPGPAAVPPPARLPVPLPQRRTHGPPRVPAPLPAPRQAAGWPAAPGGAAASPETHTAGCSGVLGPEQPLRGWEGRAVLRGQYQACLPPGAAAGVVAADHLFMRRLRLLVPAAALLSRLRKGGGGV